MKTNLLIYFGIVTIGLITLYLLNAIINRFTKGRVPENDTPLSVDVLKSFVFTGAGVSMSELVMPFQNLIKVSTSIVDKQTLLQNNVAYLSVFYGISIVAYLANLWFASLIYGLVNNEKNIFIESVNNNLGGVILYGGFLLMLTFLLKPELGYLLDQFIPYNRISQYN